MPTWGLPPRSDHQQPTEPCCRTLSLPASLPIGEATLVLRMIGQTEKETAQADRRLSACSGEVDTGSPIGTCTSQYFLEHVPIPKEQDML
jgi:hypothetical protein